MTTFMHGRRVVLTDQHNNGDDKQARARLERIKRAYMGIQLPARHLEIGDASYHVLNVLGDFMILPGSDSKRVLPWEYYGEISDRATSVKDVESKHCIECDSRRAIILERYRTRGRWQGRLCPSGIWLMRRYFMCPHCVIIEELKPRNRFPVDSLIS